jgi:hypothetical protein
VSFVKHAVSRYSGWRGFNVLIGGRISQRLKRGYQGALAGRRLSIRLGYA